MGKEKRDTLKRVVFYTCALLVVAFLVGINVSAQRADNGPLVVARVRVLVGFQDAPSQADISTVQGLGGYVRHTYDIIPAIAIEIPERAINALQKNPRVTIVEQDMGIYAVDNYSSVWGVKKIKADVVHTELQNYGTGIKVAVVDSGLDYNHEKFINLDGVSVYKGGWNFVGNNNNPMDDNGHGTHVSGTVAAVLDNGGTGVTGVSPNVDLYALKVLDANGGGNFSNAIAALDWAITNNIQVVNHSYGSAGDPGILVREAFDKAYELGIVNVAAAGNSGVASGRGDNVIYPAKYESVIAVAATDNKDKRPTWSSTGPAVEIAAPGASIYSTWPNSGFRLASGTSMASPHVAGVVALMLANDSTLTPDAIRQILKATATNLGNPLHFGAGLVNAWLAVTYGTVVEEPPVEEPPVEEPPAEEEPIADEPVEENCPPGHARRGLC